MATGKKPAAAAISSCKPYSLNAAFIGLFFGQGRRRYSTGSQGPQLHADPKDRVRINDPGLSIISVVFEVIGSASLNHLIFNCFFYAILNKPASNTAFPLSISTKFRQIF